MRCHQADGRTERLFDVDRPLLQLVKRRLQSDFQSPILAIHPFPCLLSTGGSCFASDCLWSGNERDPEGRHRDSRHQINVRHKGRADAGQDSDWQPSIGCNKSLSGRCFSSFSFSVIAGKSHLLVLCCPVSLFAVRVSLETDLLPCYVLLLQSLVTADSAVCSLHAFLP